MVNWASKQDMLIMLILVTLWQSNKDIWGKILGYKEWFEMFTV